MVSTSIPVFFLILLQIYPHMFLTRVSFWQRPANFVSGTTRWRVLWRRKKYFASAPDILLKIYSQCSKQLVLRRDYTDVRTGVGSSLFYRATGHANKLISVPLNINLIFFLNKLLLVRVDVSENWRMKM